MMKRIITICAASLMIVSVFLPQLASAQAPEKMSYQAVVRYGNNNLVSSTAVGMQISILQDSTSGAAVYVEVQTPTSNSNGLVSLEIGTGAVLSGSFASIDWSAGPYFIKTEIDPTGGTNYSIFGISQLLSVPYALHSKCVPVEVSSSGDTLMIGCRSVIIPGLSAANTLVDPFSPGTVHCSGVPTVVQDVTNPVTGKTWMDRNLGASQVATSSTDQDSYGDLYQWGRGADGHQCRNSATTSSLSSTDTPSHGNFILAPNSPYDWLSQQNNNLLQGVNGVNNPCPTGYRLPTQTELNDERISWSTNGAEGAFASSLKFPMAGYRHGQGGSIGLVGSGGRYWSSTVSSPSSRRLYFHNGGAGLDIGERANGFSIRCIKN